MIVLFQKEIYLVKKVMDSKLQVSKKRKENNINHIHYFFCILFSFLVTTLDSGRIGIAGQALGIAQASLECAVDYAQKRQVFGKQLNQMQAIQMKIAGKMFHKE